MRLTSRIGLVLGAGVVIAVLAVGVVPAVAGTAATRSHCGIAWGSVAKSAPAMTGAQLTGVRPGRHECFDRLVFDIAGRPAAGYNVRYGVARAEGTGDPLSVAGGAVLAISLKAPAYDAGNVTVPWRGPAVIRPVQFRA